MSIRTEEQYLEMFDQSWRYLAEHFYDAKFHGGDWNAVRAKYRAAGQARRHEGRSVCSALPDAGRAERLAPGHHGGFGTSPEEETADLGLIFDESYRGRGLKIAEILKRGPADRRGLNLKAGRVTSSASTASR